MEGRLPPYDLIKELCIAVGVIALLAVVLTVLFSSPDDKPSTIAQWSRQLPDQLRRRGGQGARRARATPPTYGPPYNHNGEGQHAAFIYPQKWLGVSHPINTADDFVIDPLKTVPDDPALQSAIAQYQAAPEKTQQAWAEAYAKPLEEYANGGRRREDADQGRLAGPEHGHGDRAGALERGRSRR